jgi:hypothetical protein
MEVSDELLRAATAADNKPLYNIQEQAPTGTSKDRALRPKAQAAAVEGLVPLLI